MTCARVNAMRVNFTLPRRHSLAKQPSEADKLGVLSTLAPEMASAFASIASDIALVIGPDGVIRDVALGARPLMPSSESWVGRRWADTVTSETRRKIEQLLEEASTAGVSRRREVNHPSASGTDIPVAYAAIRLGEGGPVLAAGRDLRAIAAIQQRFVDTQQEMERDYWKMRQSESRYRMLFQVATDAVMVIDGESLQIVEANQAATRLFDLSLEHLVGKPATVGVDRHSRPSLEELLAMARATGQPAEIRARLACRIAAVDISASPFRGDSGLLLLLRARAVETQQASSATAGKLADFVECMPDAVAITDSSGRVITANPAFLELCRASGEMQVKGRALGDWLGAAPGEMAAILAQVKSHGVAPRLVAAMRHGDGAVDDVEVSAALLADDDQECIGFTIRPAATGNAAAKSRQQTLGDAIARLAERAGDVPLRELLLAVTDLAERQFIQEALRRAGGDMARAAAALVMTRESLDLRMRHHGLLPGDPQGDGSPPVYSA